MLHNNLVAVNVWSYVRLKDLNYDYDNGLVFPYVWYEDGKYYVVRNGCLQIYNEENCEAL